MRYAARTDDNQAMLIATLEHCGYSVLPLHRVGGGAPDMLCGFGGQQLLVEIKSRNTRYGRAGLQDHQREWADAWRGAPPIVAYEAEDVIEAFNQIMRDER